MTWIESHQSIAEHPKTKRLRRLLGTSLPETIGYLHLLWWWAMEYADDGRLSKFSDEDIADAIGWENDPTELVGALVASGYLEEDRSIHDWSEYAGRLIDKRRRDAERKRTGRSIIKEVVGTSVGSPTDVQRTAQVTLPYPTVPSPYLKAPHGACSAIAEPRADKPRPSKRAQVPKEIISVPKPNKLGEVVDLVKAENIPISPTDRDAKAVKGCPYDAKTIADAYITVYGGEWNEWLANNLSLQAVVQRIVGYIGWRDNRATKDAARASPNGAGPPGPTARHQSAMQSPVSGDYAAYLEAIDARNRAEIAEASNA